MNFYKNKHIVYITGSIAGLSFDPDAESCPVKANHYIKIKMKSIGKALYYHDDGFDTEFSGAKKFSAKKSYEIVNKLRIYCTRNDIEIISFQSTS